MPLLTTGAGTYSAIASGSTLKNGLISFYELEEALGNSRNDSTANALHLTESLANSASTTGKVGNAVVIAANSILVHADDALYNFSGGVSVACWVRFPTSLPILNPFIVSKFRSAREFGLQFSHSSSDKFLFDVVDNTVTDYTVVSTTSIVADTWYFVAATADNSNVKISINDGTKDTAVQSGAIQNTAEDFRIGDADVASTYYVDQCGLWNRALTNAEITQLYNSGNGLSYAAM